jgi:hypothetical protein
MRLYGAQRDHFTFSLFTMRTTYPLYAVCFLSRLPLALIHPNILQGTLFSNTLLIRHKFSELDSQKPNFSLKTEND